MKYFVILIILIGFTGFVIPQVFGTSENLFSGTTSFERLPATISPNSTTQFEIKFQYTEGVYSLSNVTVIVDITPQEAASFVHFDAEPVNVYQNSIARIPVTITVDSDIEYEKIFLNISYVGTGINDVPFKSSWSDSLIFDIASKDFTSTELPSSQDYEFEKLTGARCDGEATLCYGTFYNGTTIPVQCDYRHSCGVISFDNDVFYQPPLKQFKAGIPVDKIQCRDNLQLILKTSNNSPTCVKPETKTKLLERGWGEYAPIPEPEIIKETDFDSEKYYEEFDSGSPLIYLDTSNPVLDNANCERYAYWLTKYQKEKLDKYEDYPRYPPWGNQIFPLVDYCIKNGDLIKTIVNDKIQWSFSGNSEPEFKDEKITIIKISKGDILSAKGMKFNGWTNHPNLEIVLTITAPNGNIISIGKISPMSNGTFADAITTGGPLWEQQDGIYLVTVQQGNEPTNSAYFELDLKDGNIITEK